MPILLGDKLIIKRADMEIKAAEGTLVDEFTVLTVQVIADQVDQIVYAVQVAEQRKLT
jgi:hypothetical protein